MSTKTTFKRVALVAVAALGLGVVSSVAPANAAAVSFTVNTASQTVVGTYATTNNSTKGAVAFKIQVKDNATTPVVANLSNGETITASVIAVPAKSIASGDTLPLTGDIGFLSVKNSTTLAADSNTAGTLTYLDNNCLYPVAQDATYAARGQYCIGVMPSKNIAGWGEYTIAFDLKDVNGNILQRTTVKYKMVTAAADSGAVVTLDIAGSAVAGETYLQTTTKYINASLRDANGGLVVLNDTSTTTRQPALTGSLESAAGVALNVLTAADTGSTTADAYDDAAVSNDGDYGLIPSAVVSSSISTTAASVVRVRYGLVNVTGSISAYRAATSFGSTSLRSVTGTGIYSTTETTTASGAQTFKVPMTTGSVAIKYTVKDSAGAVIADEPITITPTWSGVNAADVSGVSGTSTVSKTDASGVVTYTVTQANVIAGSSVIVAVTGIGTGTFGSVTLTWGVPTVTSASLTPSSTFKIVAAGSATFKIKVKDQFGAAMSGVVLQPSLSATSANYSATSMATVTTAADGTASVTLTGGANATSDALTWTHAVAGSLGTQTASYVTTVPVIATLTGYNNTSEGAASYPTPFSTTALGSTGTMLVSAATNYSTSLSVSGTAATDTINAFQVVAKDSAGAVVTGVPVTVTASAGSYFTDSCSGATGLLVTSKTCYPASTTGAVTIVGVVNTTGTATFTFTAGTVVASQTVFASNAATDARYVALSGDSTAVAGSNALPSMKAKVTDRFGNAVAGVTVQLSVSGAGSLGGGAKLGSFATDTNGEVNFNLQSNAEGTSSVNAYLTTVADSASTAGKSLSATVDSTLTAGVRSATASLAWSAGSSTLDQAQAATDAAAEATDAANAATDAANAAAEAADAATAAAQDAADAVAALSAQVATLISGLKAQLTALTNLVIKIQKKVKA